MEFILSKHANDVLDRRNIPREWVLRTLEYPQQTQPDKQDTELEHYLAVIPEYDHRILRVVANPRTGVIITAYFDRRMRNRFEDKN